MTGLIADLCRNLQNLTSRPAKPQEKIFSKLFDQAEVANLSKEQLESYEEIIKIHRDFKELPAVCNSH